MRQYIGARYVPRFSEVNNGIWSNVYSYEPLTIVKNGNDYYTSKKSVPIGIAITNTEYWALTGNYNGAISDLYSKIDALNDDFSKITGGYFYPEDYGAKGDGVTDDSTAINDCIEAAINNKGAVVLPSKNYGISSPIMITSPVNIYGNGSRIHALSTMSNMIHVNIPDPNMEYGRGVITGIGLFCNYRANNGIYIEKAINSLVYSDIQINNPLVACISSEIAGECNVMRTIFRNTETGHNSTAFYLKSPDNKLTDCTFVNFKVGIHAEGYTDAINVYGWNSFPERMTDSVFCETGSLVTFTGCYFDTWAKTIHNLTSEFIPVFITNSGWYWNPSVYNDTSLGDTTTIPIMFDDTIYPYIINSRAYSPSGTTQNRIYMQSASNVSVMPFDVTKINILERTFNTPKNETSITLPGTYNTTQFTYTLQKCLRVTNITGRYTQIHIEGSAISELTSDTPVFTLTNTDDYSDKKEIGNAYVLYNGISYPVYYNPTNHRVYVSCSASHVIPANTPITISISFKTD